MILIITKKNLINRIRLNLKWLVIYKTPYIGTPNDLMQWNIIDYIKICQTSKSDN